jgi:HK97 family phage major capsid protein
MTIAFGGSNYEDVADFVEQLIASGGCESREELVEELASRGVAKNVVQAIYDHQVGIREQQGKFIAKLETHSRAPLRSEKRRWDSSAARFDEAGEFIDELLTETERQQADREFLETQRKPFNAVIRGAKMEDNSSELGNWLRHGGSPTFDVPLKTTRTLGGTETHDLTTGGASAGGVVPAGFVGNFYMHMIANAAVRQTNAIVYSTSGGEPLKIPKSVTDPTAAQVAEGVAITPGDPALGSVTLGTYGFKAMTYVSRELTEDSSVDIEEILGRLLGRAIGTASGVQYVLGDGTTEPQGVALSPVDGVVTTWALLVAGATGPDLLEDLYTSINAPYRPQAQFLMNDAVLSALRKLKDTTNNRVIQRSLVDDPVETIFGRPVIADPNLSTGAGTGTRILFGDFSSYFAIRDVGTVRLERSDDYRFANDEIAFRAVLRTDSKQVLNDTTNSAVKALRITA